MTVEEYIKGNWVKPHKTPKKRNSEHKISQGKQNLRIIHTKIIHIIDNNISNCSRTKQ